MQENKEAMDEQAMAAAQTAQATEAEDIAAEQPTASAEQAELAALRAKVEQLSAAAKEKDDRYLRMAAEYDNFRRRSREEREGVYNEALADAVGELLPVLDNLERAAAFEDGMKVKEGLAMTAKIAAAALEKLGVVPVGAVGETFDPNLHNAVLHEEDEEHAEGEILEVFQKGYKKGNKIIRFAMVKTAN